MAIVGLPQSHNLDHFKKSPSAFRSRQWVRLPIRDADYDLPVYVRWDGQQVQDVAVEALQDGVLLDVPAEERARLALAALLWLQA